MATPNGKLKGGKKARAGSADDGRKGSVDDGRKGPVDDGRKGSVDDGRKGGEGEEEVPDEDEFAKRIQEVLHRPQRENLY